jgi:predicted nucleic acid-binding protein
MIVQRIAGAYVVNLRQNSHRCVILQPGAVSAVPADLASVTNVDDHYLIQAQLSVNGAILVTTDGALCNAVKQAGLACLSRQEFLSTYL